MHADDRATPRARTSGWSVVGRSGADAPESASALSRYTYLIVRYRNRAGAIPVRTHSIHTYTIYVRWHRTPCRRQYVRAVQSSSTNPRPVSTYGRPVFPRAAHTARELGEPAFSRFFSTSPCRCGWRRRRRRRSTLVPSSLHPNCSGRWYGHGHWVIRTPSYKIPHQRLQRIEQNYSKILPSGNVSVAKSVPIRAQLRRNFSTPNCVRNFFRISFSFCKLKNFGI